MLKTCVSPVPTEEESLDDDVEQDETKENTTNDVFTVQEEDGEEFTALNAEQVESGTTNDDMPE